MKSRFTGENSLTSGPSADSKPEARPGVPLELKEQTRGAAGKLDVSIPKLPVLGSKMLDSKRVRIRPGFEREEGEYADAEFEALKASIADTGSNISPIDVRLLHNVSGYDAELLAGTRRLKACQQLKVNVLAVVRDCDDQMADRIHEVENKHRKNKSPYSRGLQYRAMWESKRYATKAEMAQTIQSSAQEISDALNLVTEAPEGMWAKVSNPASIKTNQTRQLMAAYKLPAFIKAIAEAQTITVDQLVSMAAKALKPAPAPANDSGQTRLAKRGKDFIVKLPAGISEEVAKGATAAAKKYVESQRK